MDIIVDVERQSARVVGSMTSAAVFPLRGRVAFVGVRFRPGGLSPLLTTSAHEVTDSAADPIETLAVPDAVRELGERLLESPPESWSRRTEAAVARWLDAHPPSDGRVLEAARLLRRGGGRSAIGDVAEAVGLSLRSLERKYRRHVGVPPKLAARVERLRRAAEAMDRHPDVGLSSVAYRSGYADQAHLTRDFTELAGLPPARWRRERSSVAFVQDACSLSD